MHLRNWNVNPCLPYNGPLNRKGFRMFQFVFLAVWLSMDKPQVLAIPTPTLAACVLLEESWIDTADKFRDDLGIDGPGTVQCVLANDEPKLDP